MSPPDPQGNFEDEVLTSLLSTPDPGGKRPTLSDPMADSIDLGQACSRSSSTRDAPGEEEAAPSTSGRGDLPKDGVG